MKTKIFLFAGIIATLFTCQNMNAQLKYGLHAGVSSRTQAELGELWNNTKFSPGSMFGGFLEYTTGKNLSIQTEINYQVKGEKCNTVLSNSETITQRNFNYLSVPILIKGTFGKELDLGENWNLSGFAGPYFGYLTSAKNYIKTGEIITKNNSDNLAEKSDWGVIIGEGLSYNLGNGRAVIMELRYEMGLGKVDKQDVNLRNKVFGLNVGYRF